MLLFQNQGICAAWNAGVEADLMLGHAQIGARGPVLGGCNPRNVDAVLAE